MASTSLPTQLTDPINAKILAVSEDRIQGFHEQPFREISRLSGVEQELVHTRIRAMLESGLIRRVRQTLLATNLAPGSLVAWQLPADRLDAAFNYLYEQDPFSGHVVIRTTDSATPGSSYRLWTTVKVPQGYSMEKHCRYLMQQTGAETFRLMPAKCLFTLGVGHVRRRGLEPGSRSDEPAQVTDTRIVELDDLEWRVLVTVKREFDAQEIVDEPWRSRAAEAGIDYATFLQVARQLNQKAVIGRFSTFLEHVKPVADGQRVTRFNALFHWAVPPGLELKAGSEVGRHHVLTHAYWREGGPEFRNVNIMAVAHGTDRAVLLQHKAAIDEHLREAGIEVSYTNVFWGGRSEIKPSEIAPQAYREWCQSVGIDPESMRAE